MGDSAVSFDVLERRVELLLEEWGECQRRTPSPWVRGYPHATVEARLMEDYGRISRTDRRRRWAWKRNSRKTVTADRTHNVVVMAPERSDRSSRGGPRVAGSDWPDYIISLDMVLAAMPERLRRAILLYYGGQHSLRSAASIVGVSRDEMERRVDRGRWYIASRLCFIDRDL